MDKNYVIESDWSIKQSKILIDLNFIKWDSKQMNNAQVQKININNWNEFVEYDLTYID